MSRQLVRIPIVARHGEVLRRTPELDWPREPGRTITPASESTLFHAYARTRADRVEPCVCGGSIRAPGGASSDEIREAVAVHNSSTSHVLGMRR